MQTTFQVFVRRGPSFRQHIIKDIGEVWPEKDKESCYLRVLRGKAADRNPGWAKVAGRLHGYPGTINFAWDPNASVLLCRAITKGRNRPHDLMGDFVAYLLQRHWKRILAINVQTPHLAGPGRK